MSAHVITTDDRGFDATVLQSRGPVLVDFWAPRCAPCRIIGPVIEELAAVYHGRLRVVKVNADDNMEVTGRYGISAIPSLLFFKDGRVAHRVVGAWPRARLAAAIEQVLAATGEPVG